VPDASNVGLSDLVSPSFLLPSGPIQLSFANNYDLEPNNALEAFDGGVLEIKIGAGAFTDILAAGGTFVTNGYTHTISTNFSNPLGGRSAWSGTSPGFLPTVVNLPPSAGGQTVQLRWRCGTDNSNGRSGWHIDAIAINGRACCANGGPVLAAQPYRTIAELTQLTVTNSATDANTPAANLTYTLVNPPAGATINTTGVIQWIPTETQGPGNYSLTTIVSDNASPPLTATNSFGVTVTEINLPPALPSQINRTIAELTTMRVTNTASDPDIPLNNLSYVLVGAPAGATISVQGIIQWMPADAQRPSTNIINTVVTDDGVPPLSATNSFTAVAQRLAAQPPVLQSLAISNQVASVRWTSIAGYLYRLQSCDDLSSTTWSNTGFELMATSSSSEGTNLINGASQRFYRVVLVP
jgi:hypothetical protein